MNEAAAGELAPGMSLRDGPLRSGLKIPRRMREAAFEA